MKLGKLLLAGIAIGTLGGCAVYPYDGYGNQSRGYYSDAYRGGYYGAPGYYPGPSVGLGITYSDRGDDWRGRERRHRHWDHD